MSNSMSDDYFDYMSGRGQKKPAAAPSAAKLEPKPAVKRADVIDFVDDSQMIVTETSITDTMIQRIFRRPAGG